MGGPRASPRREAGKAETTMLRKAMTTTLLATVALGGIRGSAHAEVMCKTARGLLRMRPACRLGEIALPISIEDGGLTVRITGANLQVVSGAGATAAAVNGLGNVIVGYNEAASGSGERDRGGSHNVVVGQGHGFSSHSGLVVGESNVIDAPYASVTAGQFNQATGWGAAVSGGSSNTASGIAASVGGGSGNQATGATATVSGGSYGSAAGEGSVVSGGLANHAQGDYSSASGGIFNLADGMSSSVSGGSYNQAYGEGSWIGGGGMGQATGNASSVSGGNQNTAAGDFSSVSGGHDRSADEYEDWRAGDYLQDR